MYRFIAFHVLRGRAHAWNPNLRTPVLDFTKALDEVRRGNIWRAQRVIFRKKTQLRPLKLVRTVAI